MFDDFFDKVFGDEKKELVVVDDPTEGKEDQWSTGREQSFWKNVPEAGTLWKN